MSSVVSSITGTNSSVTETKTRANLNGEPIPTFKFRTEEVTPRVQSTIIESTNIGGDTLIWGNEDYGCFTPDTEILTTQGIKLVKDCQVGELVYSVNPETLETEIKPIIDTQEYDYNGIMHHFISDRMDFLVTPNHNMLLRKQIQKNNKKVLSKPMFIKPEDMKSIRYKIPEHKKMKFGEKHDPDLLYFYGIFLSEGCLSHNIRKGKSNGYWVEIAQYESVNPKICRKIEECLDNLFLTYKRTLDKKKYILYSKELYEHLSSLFGIGSYNKRIPNFLIEEYDEESLKALYDGMYDGDGDKDVNRYSTASIHLRDGFIHLLTRFGYRWRYLYETNNKTGNGIWRIFFKKGDNNAVINKEQHKKVAYSGKIFCVTVKDNHTVLVGRNGKFDWCGQSWGASKWGNSSYQSFILGLSPLGNNSLGSRVSEPVIILVKLEGNYVEDFGTLTFCDTSNTTADWGGLN